MPEGVDYASSNVIAGTGLELNYVQDRVYAFSGESQINTSDVTALDFTTGGKTIVGTFTFCGSIKMADVGNGTVNAFQVSLNGQVVSILKVATNTDDQPSMQTYDTVIPPYTNVNVVVKDSGSTSAGFFTTTMFIGKTLQ